MPGALRLAWPVPYDYYPWHVRLGDAYRFDPPNGQTTCNCTPPELIDVADADAYLATTLKAASWAALTSDEKAQALKSAQDALRTLKWCTDETTCCGKDLTESYTAAASELALVLFANASSVFGAATQLPASPVRMQKLGDLQQEFFSPATAWMQRVLPVDGRVGRYSPTVLRMYPWLLDLIGCWVDRQSNNRIPLYRG